MTQLVGWILRQPYAVKTKVPALDECHVITHHAGSAEVVRAIKDGLEKDGLSDLVLSVAGGGETGGPAVSRKVKRRAAFKTVEIYLPRVLRLDGGKMRDLNYETDLLAAIDWRGYDPVGVVQVIP